MFTDELTALKYAIYNGWVNEDIWPETCNKHTTVNEAV